MLDKPKKKWKLQTALILWAVAATYFAVYEIDNRLRSHYAPQEMQQIFDTLPEHLKSPMPVRKP